MCQAHLPNPRGSPQAPPMPLPHPNLPSKHHQFHHICSSKKLPETEKNYSTPSPLHFQSVSIPEQSSRLHPSTADHWIHRELLVASLDPHDHWPWRERPCLGPGWLSAGVFGDRRFTRSLSSDSRDTQEHSIEKLNSPSLHSIQLEMVQIN